MLTIDQKDLEAYATAAARIASERGHFQATRGVLLHFDGAVLEITATDMLRRLMSRTRLVKHGPDAKSFTALVSARAFLDAVKAMGGPVKLAPTIDTAGLTTRLRVTSGPRERDLATLGDDYLTCPELPSLESALKVEGGALLRLIDGVGWAASTEPAVPEKAWITGISISWSPEWIKAMAFDGIQLAEQQIAGSGCGHGSVCIPLAAARCLAMAGKRRDDDGVALEIGERAIVKVAATERIVRIDTGDSTLLAASIGSAPEILPAADTGPHVIVPRQRLLESAKLLRGFDTFSLGLYHSEVVLAAQDAGSRAVDKISDVVGTEGFRVTLSARQMVSALSCLDDESVRIMVCYDSVRIVPEPQRPGVAIRIGRFKGDETPGVGVAEEHVCTLCGGSATVLVRAAKGLNDKRWSQLRGAHITVRVLPDAKTAPGDSEQSCPVCTDTTLPDGHAVVRR